MTTEYEQLLSGMLEQKKAKAAELTGKHGKKKELDGVLSDIRFLEVELQRYQQGMSLFRNKANPKVGRWGEPATEGHGKEH